MSANIIKIFSTYTPALLKDKVVIVTGGASGIGYDAAKHFASLSPSHLILTTRSISSGNAAVEKIKATLPQGSVTKIESWYIDFTKLKTVKEFVERAKKDLGRLDILVSNAGVAKNEKEVTGDGFEVALQVNCIANSYLCSALLPLLRKTSKKFSSKTRVTIVGSGAYDSVTDLPSTKQKSSLWTLNDLGTEGTDFKPTYSETKTINILDTETLADLAGEDVSIICITPGLVKSNLDRDMPDTIRAQIAEHRVKVGVSSEEGSKTLVVASTEDYPSGSYLSSKGDINVKSEFVRSERGQSVKKEIWEDYQKIWSEHGLL